MTCQKCDRDIHPKSEKYIHAHDKTVVHVKCPISLLGQIERAHNAVADMQEDLEYFGIKWRIE